MPLRREEEEDRIAKQGMLLLLSFVLKMIYGILEELIRPLDSECSSVSSFLLLLFLSKHVFLRVQTNS